MYTHIFHGIQHLLISNFAMTPFLSVFLNRISCNFKFLLFILLFLFLPQQIKMSFHDLHIHDFFPILYLLRVYIMFFSHFRSQLPPSLSVSRYLSAALSLSHSHSLCYSISLTRSLTIFYMYHSRHYSDSKVFLHLLLLSRKAL